MNSETITLPIPAATVTAQAAAGERGVTATEFSAYVTHPEGAPKGALVVIHEVWGLVEHITGIADRFAAEGYLVIAPDLMSSIGIEAQVGLELNAIMKSTDDKVRSEGQPRLRAAFAGMNAPEFGAWALAALGESVDYLEQQPGIEGRIAVTGFCFGGSYSFALAAADSRIRAAVPFYGAPPQIETVAHIAGPVLAFYGRTDTNLIDSLPEVTAAMQAAGIDFTSHVYEDAGHAFFNDTNAFMYRADAAADSWQRTLAFLNGALAG
ncbi:dienelactone hydrolase family protein [Glaciihabitans sp. INWT7]|uniref:dienelactone hydrolase family protein n=1 Tax=Glaciihabitans sp. INWT7 TaxID=2596912 RepID=UPI0016252D22|nr:dienelactone hydrolase family protein [Glaciihabitans sp. INWT7]QNE46504.1 dienelactone hydrolase family protein [Glaciihabitans sp. INWT7]